MLLPHPLLALKAAGFGPLFSYAVVDKAGTVLFEEMLEEDSWNSGTSAKKVGKFSYEELIGAANEWADKFDLHSHEEWRDYVCVDMVSCGYKGYVDNWLYSETEMRGKEKLGKLSGLGIEYRVLKEDVIHKITEKRWSRLYITPKGESYRGAICGYIF